MGDSEWWSLGLWDCVRWWVSIINKYKKHLGVRKAYHGKYDDGW